MRSIRCFTVTQQKPGVKVFMRLQIQQLQILFSDRPPLTSFAYAGNHFVSTEWLHATRTFSDQQHTGFHRGKTLAAFRAYATPTDGMTVIANARINDFGVGVLAKRTMHAPQNNVYGRKNHAARVSFTQPEQ